MRALTKTTFFFIAAFTPFLLSVSGAGCGSSSSTTGGAGTGGGGKGAAGTGAAGTGAAGTGAAGTGAAGTGAAGTGTAGTGAAGTGVGTDAGTDAAEAGTDAAGIDAKEAGTDLATDVATNVTDAAGADTAVNACTNVVLPAAVFAHYLTAAAPAPAGGDLVAGTYSLTELNHYGSATASTSNDPIRVGLTLTATTIAWASKNKDEAEMRSSYTYTKGTNKLVLTIVCPTAGAGEMPGYTSTATTFKIYLDAEYVFTKQ